MNEHSESPTIRYYDDHADEYVRETVGIDMSSFYGPFLELLPKGGKILDAGCGSGRDSKAFLEMTYDVTPIDASKKMAIATTRLTGLTACHLRFQDIVFQEEFDGIWACASLLHVPRKELGDVLDRLSRSLRTNGVCYMSFKEGGGERTQGVRLFSDFTTSFFKGIIDRHNDFDIIRLWTTIDARPNNTDRWINALVNKRSDCSKN